ncbi:hypothetical protein D3C71_1641080 [compost metagenome]
MIQHALRHVAHIGSAFLKIRALHIFEHGYELGGHLVHGIIRVNDFFPDFVLDRVDQFRIVQNKQVGFENLRLLLAKLSQGALLDTLQLRSGFIQRIVQFGNFSLNIRYRFLGDRIIGMFQDKGARHCNPCRSRDS